MGKIIRDPEGSAKEKYDLIIIGGGIYGVMLSYEAAKRGLQALLIDRRDFGGATTFNCLRILHGGLRYLQTMDLHRFRESVAERRWFLKHFPGLVSPLPCLMPLYGAGLRRPAILNIAVGINDFLSRKRNAGIIEENHIPRGKTISIEETGRIFPKIDTSGLKGGVVWYDAYMPDPQFILLEILKKSCLLGSTAINYLKVEQVNVKNHRITGVSAQDQLSGRTYKYQSEVVVNAAGPWCRELANSVDKDYPELFRSSIAWNVLFDRPALSDHALAVAPKKRAARTYFLLPWKGRLLAGTGHDPWIGGTDHPEPTEHMMKDFLDDLNLAVPKLQIALNDILHVFSGLLPVSRSGGVDLTKREVTIDHSKTGGPSGLYSVSGIKFTTARLVADKMLNKAFPQRNRFEGEGFEKLDCKKNGWQKGRIFNSDWKFDTDSPQLKSIKDVVENEAVLTVDDLLYRRTNLWENNLCSPNLRKRLQMEFKLAPTLEMSDENS